MNIDFNHVRRQAVDAYGEVVKALKQGKDGHKITVELCWIERCLEDLRSALVGIACTYEEDNPDFAAILGGEEVLPVLCDDEEEDT